LGFKIPLPKEQKGEKNKPPRSVSERIGLEKQLAILKSRETI
jgi:hypothetical protein